MNYNYLCCTDYEIYQTHIPDVSVPLPECWDGSYNYYKRNGQYYEYFDYDTVYNALMNSVWSEQDYIVLKFGTWDGYETAKYELFQNHMLNDAGIRAFTGKHQSGTVSFLPDKDCEEFAYELAEKGFAVRAGLHCAPLAHESAGTIHSGTVRASFGYNSTDWQMENFVNSVKYLSQRK